MKEFESFSVTQILLEIKVTSKTGYSKDFNLCEFQP